MESFDVMCVLDESGSIPYHSRHSWAQMKDFCKEVVRTFDAFASDSRFGVVEFSDRAEVTVRLARGADDVIEATDHSTLEPLLIDV